MGEICLELFCEWGCRRWWHAWLDTALVTQRVFSALKLYLLTIYIFFSCSDLQGLEKYLWENNGFVFMFYLVSIVNDLKIPQNRPSQVTV